MVAGKDDMRNPDVPPPPAEDLKAELADALKRKHFRDAADIIQEMVARAIDEHEMVNHSDV